MDDTAAGRAPWLARRLGSVRWRGGWVAMAAAIGLAAGLVADSLSAGLANGTHHFLNLLAPPVWTVLAWNLAVYAAMLVQRAFAPRRAAPLWTRRAETLLHTAAAGLAAGLIVGMYLRGMVFDYRAGWESTFLDAGAVSALLSWALAPAAALTGITLPDAAALQTLRVGPGDAAGGAAIASARPWIHLLAATLALVVLLPRSLLALHAGWRASQASAAGPGRRREAVRLHVLPHAQAPGPQALPVLRAALAACCGEPLQLSVAPAVAYGAEAQAAELVMDGALPVPLFDLAATPEADTQGRLVEACLKRRGAARATPPIVVIDEAAFLRRFAATPGRVAERRAAWTAFAAGHGATPVFVDLSAAPS